MICAASCLVCIPDIIVQCLPHLYVIGDKWKLRIIVALTDGNKRFNELQRLVEGISKVLSSELKDLEINGFVNRNVFTGTPAVVEYELSEYAEKLNGVLHSLSEWGRKA